jgi:hypothetical protein
MKIKGIDISDDLDLNNEVEIWMAGSYEVINRDDAINIMTQLQNLFRI